MCRREDDENMIKPIEFIDRLRQSDSYIKVIYTEGGCFQFFKILKSLYPSAKAIKVKLDNTIYNHGVLVITQDGGLTSNDKGGSP